MDLFSIGGSLWRHKKVSIPVILLTLLGVAYVLLVQSATYQADAKVLLTNPPAPPSAVQIVQDPALAKTDNPFANLGNLTYVADALIDEVNAPADRDTLTEAGASEYQVALDDADQTSIPPAIDIIGTAANAQAAMQSVRLVSAAMMHDLNQMQLSQDVQSKYMINAVEYVTPTSATKVSSGRLRVAVGVVAIGLIVLLVAVSMAQGRAEHKRRSRREGRPAHRERVRREPPDRTSEPARTPGMQPSDSGKTSWGQSG
jgi:hypothetical protein